MPRLQRTRRTRDYVVRMPRDRRIRTVCEDINCELWRYGWDTILDERTTEGREAAQWIRSGQSGRDYKELHGPDVTVFRFASRQRCFTEHRTRPASWQVRNGAQVVAQHTDMSAWISDLDEHVGQLEEAVKRG